MFETMEPLEPHDSASKDEAELAEKNMRAFERADSVRSDSNDAQPSLRDETTRAKQTSDRNFQEVHQSFLDKAKDLAVLGAAGTILIGSGFILGHDALEHKLGEPGRVGFGETIQTQVSDQKNLVNNAYTESASVSLESTKDISPAFDSAPASVEEDKWWLNVPESNQHSLTYENLPTEYGCVPTSASMILNYWHQKDVAYPEIGAQELLNANALQGEFNARGMSATNIHDELDRLGYATTDHTNANQDEIKDAVAEGPVIAIVKLGMKAEGTNHAVVVTGISEKSEVRINDPWTGKSQTYSWDKFSKSWGADFGRDAPRNSFVSIQPKSM